MRNIKLRIDNWLISNWDEGKCHFLYHACGGVHPHAVVYTRLSAGLRSSLLDAPEWRCTVCGKPAPDSIVGAYALLEMDYVGGLVRGVRG